MGTGGGCLDGGEQDCRSEQVKELRGQVGGWRMDRGGRKKTQSIRC